MKTTLKFMDRIAETSVKMAKMVEPIAPNARHIYKKDYDIGKPEQSILPEWEYEISIYNDVDEIGEYRSITINHSHGRVEVWKLSTEEIPTITIPINATGKWLNNVAESLESYCSVLDEYITNL